MQRVLDSEWGRLFANWGKVQTDAEGKGYPNVGVASPELTRKLTHAADRSAAPGRHGAGRVARVARGFNK